MSEQMGYDEDAAVKFIRGTLPKDKSDLYSDDEILYVIDTIWDWYEKNGYTSLDSDVTDSELDHIDDIVAYVRKEMGRAKEFVIDNEDIPLLVRGELQYEESIEDDI